MPVSAPRPASTGPANHGLTLWPSRTVTVPVGIMRGSLSFNRINRLFVLCALYEARSMEVALVDPDGTVIVSHFAPRLVAPEPVMSEGKAEEEDTFEADAA